MNFRQKLHAGPIAFGLLLNGCGMFFDHGASPIDAMNRGATGFLSKTLVRGNRRRGYVIFVPASYTPATTTQYSAIVFLHSSTQGGSDTHALLDSGLAPYVNMESDTFPFIVIFPQSTDGTWRADSDNAADAIAELDAVTQSYPVDPDRVSLMGIETGGYGTWAIGAKYNDRFAALVPLASTGSDRALAASLTHVPIRAYCSKDGDFFAGTHDRDMVKSVNAQGGSATFTATPTDGPDCWEWVFGGDDMFKWLAAQRRNR